MKKIILALATLPLLVGVNAQAGNAVLPCGSFGAVTEAGYCTMFWSGDPSTPTTATFTYPEGASNLQAIIVGAGSGAYNSPNFDGPPFTTYSGNAGKVRYADLSDIDTGTVLNIVAAQPGEKGSWSTAGGDSSIAYGSTTLTAAGGPAASAADTPCTYSYTFNGLTSTHPGSARQGSSALGDSVVNGDGTCGARALGVDPTVDDDSYGNEPLSMFDASKTPIVGGARLGNAGQINPTVDGMAQEIRVEESSIGDGGNIAIELRTTLNEPGGSTNWLGRLKESSTAGMGAVFLRWTPGVAEENNGNEENSNSGGTSNEGTSGEKSPTLADTGADVELAWLAFGLIVFGAALTFGSFRSIQEVRRIRKH